jgi:probable O-glycosylation ligase (exosortase A-associated)
MKGLVFTYLLTYGGALASLFNPFIGLLVYVSFAIIRPEHMWYWSVPQGNYSRIVAMGLLIGWAFKGLGSWSFRQARPIVFALLAYWLWSAILAIGAPNPDVAWAFVEILSKIVLPFLVGITTIDSLQKLKTLAWVILLSQGYAALEFNLSYLQGYNRLAEEGFGGMDNNGNAIALVTCVGLAFFLGLHAARWWCKAIALGAAALMTHAILFSNSRGGMLSLIVTGAMTFVLLPKRPVYFLLFATGILLTWRLAGPQVIARFETAFAGSGERDASAESRVQLWAACWDSMQNEPLGLGPDHFPLIVEKYGFRRGKQAHSLWMQLGADLGFPGLFLILLFYLTCIRRLWPLARNRRPELDPSFGHLARIVISSLTGFIISAQFVSVTAVELPYYLALIGAGILKLTPSPSEILVDRTSTEEERLCFVERSVT